MTESDLLHIADGARSFLKARQTPGEPFGHFNQCADAKVASELSGATVGLELWRMLRMPVERQAVDDACDRLAAMQDPQTGLMIDPSWVGRLEPRRARMLCEGDSFFTRTTVCALAAWGRTLPHPVAHVQRLNPDELDAAVRWTRGGHDAMGVGDLAGLLWHHTRLGLPDAERLSQTFRDATAARQDPATGLWPTQCDTDALTPAINLTFHTIMYTFNHVGLPLPRAAQAIDACLAACDDPRHYGQDTGYACNDLDLALVLYTASTASPGHRADEVADWARRRLPMMVGVQKPDGGFSFYHDRAMAQHAGLDVSPGRPQGDLWGTLMYLGTIAMMTRLGYPGVDAPWGLSVVHRVPERRVSV